jgi:hypothetical protein
MSSSHDPKFHGPSKVERAVEEERAMSCLASLPGEEREEREEREREKKKDGQTFALSQSPLFSFPSSLLCLHTPAVE